MDFSAGSNQTVLTEESSFLPPEETTFLPSEESGKVVIIESNTVTMNETGVTEEWISE